MENDFVSVHKLTYATQDDHPILDNVSFSIPKGAIVSLLGESGSGKSTVLRALSGLISVDAGDISLRGEHVTSAETILVSPGQRKLAYMFQDYALFPHMTALRNMTACDHRKHKNAQKQADAEDILSRLEIEDCAEKYPHEMSGGEQQRLALARTLIMQRDLILLDEPFSHLDTRLRDKLRNIVIKSFKERGATVIMVTHDPAEAMQFSDQIIYMRSGTVVQSGTPEDFYLRPVDFQTAQFGGLVNAYLGDMTEDGLQTDIGVFPVTSEYKKTILSLRYENFMITKKENALIKGVLTHKLFAGAYYVCHITSDLGGDIIAYLQPEDIADYHIGEVLYLSPKPGGVMIFDAENCPDIFSE
ncbi:MAG: ABC transporter ATP-binding protein [Pseudomonadota bacterium]